MPEIMPKLMESPMLILTRKRGQRITIGDVVITVTHTGKFSTKIGIEAPRHIPISRDDRDESSSNHPGTTAQVDGRTL